MMRAGADQSVVRELNRSAVLSELKLHGPMSRTAIAQATSLAKPTVSEIIEGLIAEGVVLEIGLGSVASRGGRPPMLLTFNERSQYVAGVHIGTRTSTVVIADATGAEITRRRVENSPRAAEHHLDLLAGVVMEMAEEFGTPLQRFGAVGAVLPGLTDHHRGVCVLGPNVGWQNVPVRELLTDRLALPVFVHNTAQASVVAEATEGAARGETDVVLLYSGNGVGAGILSGGRVFHGSSGIAGELGHCRLPGATKRCSCGKIGCLETVASVRSLFSLVWRSVADSPESRLRRVRQRDLSLAMIRAAAEAGDEAVRAPIAEVARSLAIGASWVVNLFNPAVLVIGGGLAELGELVIEPLREAVRTLAMAPCSEHLSVRGSELGQDAEVRGAVLLALQQADSRYRVVFES